MGVWLRRGPWVVSPASVLAWGLHVRARGRARGHPRGEIGRTARWGARSTRIAAFGLLARLPTPLRATPVFVFFSFSCFSWLSARQAPRVFAPLRLWRIGESGPRATEREEARHSAVLMRTNVPTNAECTCAGNGIAKGAAARHRRCHCHMEKRKES
jgi:hypothetical protein